MTRPRIASNILEARGTFRKNPQRARPDEPTVDAPFPSVPPSCLTDLEADSWREIVGIAPAGVLTAADVVIVEICACLLAEYRADRSLSSSRLSHLRQCLARLGLDPSGRASLRVDRQPERGEFDDL
jgi:hypothetical protein